MRKWIIIGSVVALAMAFAFYLGLFDRLFPKAEDENTLMLYGNVDIRQVELGFRVSGRLTEVVVEEGGTVSKGQVLAKLDTRPFTDQIAVNTARVASQAASLAKLEAGSRQEEIEQARAQLEEAEADLTNAEKNYRRSLDLQHRGVTTTASLEDARATLDMSKARTESAREQVLLLEAGSRVEDIAAAQANLQEAQANLETAKTSLADATLSAPDSGVILSRVNEPGHILSVGETVLVLSLVKPIWVRAYVSEADLGLVRPGLEVEITSDTFPDRPYKGRIGFVSSVSEFTPKSVETEDLRTALVYRLRVIVEADDDTLRQGMPVTVRVPQNAEQVAP